MQNIFEVRAGEKVGIDTRGAWIQVTHRRRFLRPSITIVKLVSKNGVAHFVSPVSDTMLVAKEYSEAY